VEVKNSNGETVRTYDLKNLKKGQHSVTWNGRDAKDLTQPIGEYYFQVEAKSSAGTKLAVKTDFSGTITGVNYTPEGPVLMIGNQTIRIKDVKKIMDPNLQNDQKKETAVPQDLKNNAVIAQNNNETEGAPDPGPIAKVHNIMESVGLSRELMTKLEKETR
jgi:hypothetical protein